MHLNLTKISVDTSVLPLRQAWSELVRHQRDRAESGCPWGYFPNLEPGEDGLYPESIRLASQLSPIVSSSIDDELSLAFLRVSEGEVTAGYGGLHFDVDVEVTQPRPNNTVNILRVLVNLHNRPRTLQYADVTREELEERGITIPTSRYEVLELPSDIALKRFEIPARKSDALYALSFWGDLVPHVGLTGDEGHFFASYGAYKTRLN